MSKNILNYCVGVGRVSRGLCNVESVREVIVGTEKTEGTGAALHSFRNARSSIFRGGIT